MRFELDRVGSIRFSDHFELVSSHPLGMVKVRFGTENTRSNQKSPPGLFFNWDSGLFPLARRSLVRPVYSDAPKSSKEMVSIAVPTKDQVAQLELCLASIRRCHPECELIVVDDGSHQAIAVAEIAEKHRATLIRRSPGGGPASARNIALANSRREYVLFVDSDVILVPPTLDRLLCWFQIPEVMAAGPRVLAGGNGYDPGPMQRAFHARFGLDMGRSNFTVDDFDPGQPKSSRYFPSAVLLVKRQAVMELGGFDEGLRYAEDVDLLWRIAQAKGLSVYDPRAWAYHLIEPKPTKQMVKSFQYGRSNSPLAKRHAERMSAFSTSDQTAMAVGMMPFLSPSGLVAALLFPAIRFAAHSHHGFSSRLTRKASLAILAQTAAGVEDLYSRTYLAPIIVLSLFHKGMRRTLLWLLVIRALRLATSQGTGSILLFDLMASLANDIAYSLGAWEKAISDQKFTWLRFRLTAFSSNRHGHS